MRDQRLAVQVGVGVAEMVGRGAVVRHRRGPGPEQVDARVARVAEQRGLQLGQQHRHRALRVPGEGQRLRVQAAQVQRVAVVQRGKAARFDRAERIVGRQLAVHGGAHILPPVRQRHAVLRGGGVRRVEVHGVKPARAAHMVDMAVRDPHGQRLIGQGGHIFGQVPHAGTGVDQQRALAAFDQKAAHAGRVGNGGQVRVQLFFFKIRRHEGPSLQE